MKHQTIINCVAAAVLLAVSDQGVLALYTIYSDQKLTDSLRAWQKVKDDATGQPGAIQCSAKGQPADPVGFYSRPSVECGGQIMEYFECRPGYVGTSTKAFEGQCMRGDLKVIDRDWHGSEFGGRKWNNCPAEFEREYFGLPGSSFVHCWKQCRAGYVRRKTTSDKNYWWCQRDCNADGVKPKGFEVMQEADEYCLYQKA